MSSITGMANITTNKAFSSEALSKPTNQQLLNQNTVFSMLHIFLILLEYTNLWDFCHTCPLLFNKYKKHTNYKLNDDYSHLYKNDETFRNMVLSRIVNPQKQLYLNLNFYFEYYNIFTVEELSVLGNVYSLNLSGCKITNTNMCDGSIDLSVLENVHSLNLSSCRFLEIININKIHTLNLGRCLITDVTPLKDVRVLNLQHCYNIRNVSPLRNVRYICLYGCRISDLSGLENIDTLDLCLCNNITDVSSLSSVRIIDLSFCRNITHTDALVNVSALNLSNSPVDVFTLGKLIKKVPTLLVNRCDVDCPKYVKFREDYLGMFHS